MGEETSDLRVTSETGELLSQSKRAGRCETRESGRRVGEGEVVKQVKVVKDSGGG